MFRDKLGQFYKGQISEQDSVVQWQLNKSNRKGNEEIPQEEKLKQQQQISASEIKFPLKPH